MIFRYDIFMTVFLPLKFLSSRISYCTISYWFHKVILLFLSYLSLSESDASWICIWICVSISYIMLRKIPKVSPRTYIFQWGFLVGLYSVPLIIERLILKLRKELVNELGELVLTKERNELKRPKTTKNT